MSIRRDGDNSGQRVLVIGLDCAAPEFVFRHPDYDLPNLHALMDRGAWGSLRSCDPPITVPAWSCMTSGRDPGALGIYGFRNPRSRDRYGDFGIATSRSVRESRIWDIAGDAGRNVCVVGVPQTFPVKTVNGCLVSGLLTLDQEAACTYPSTLREELIDALGSIQFDVNDFRTEDKENLFERIVSFMENRFAVSGYLMKNKPWDFFMMVEMGLDRLHHAFWRFADPSHPKFEESNPFRWHVKRYYEQMDRHIGELLALAGEDVKVAVVSDHGAKAMHGGIRINQWLMDRGYLSLKRPLDASEPFDVEKVDWSRTVAWGEGGYYGRVFVNVRDREPEGTVAPEELDSTVSRLKSELEAMPGPDGLSLGNRALRPADLYPQVHGIAPELLVYFGDLHWRSLGEVGASSIYAETNDRGPDDANHAMEGIVILSDGDGEELSDASLFDIAPTVLNWMGLPVSPGMQGNPLLDG
ncbi:MAG: alkaline phosphatase family protein [Candidatus Hydrogenedentota bacterium]